MGPLGVPELLIVLALVLLLFGVGRISKIGNELGKGISSFREGLKEGNQDDKNEEKSENNE